MSSTNNFVNCIPEDAFTKEKLTYDIKNGVILHNAISWSAENGHTELTKALINLGAAVNENRNYPLELASRNGHTEIVKMLLEAGANTCDSKPDEGYCLRMAAYNGYTTIVKLLLDAGANPMADNYKALKLALCKQHMDVVELLLDSIYQKRTIVPCCVKE